MSVSHHHHHSHEIDDEESERKTRIVIIITLVTMVIEIYAGIVTKSMGLLADGWHMGTHAGALSITLYAYYYARTCLLYTSPSPRDGLLSRMPSSA